MGTISEDRNNQLLFAPGERWTISKYIFVTDSVAPAVLSAVANSTLKNHGIIRGVTAGVAFEQGSSAGVIRNGATGVIKATAGDGIRFDGDGVSITNAGGIVGSANGVWFRENATDMVLNNSGDILGGVTGVYEYSNHDGGIVTNSGLIRGGDYGVDVYTASGLTTTIQNRAGGTIEGGTYAIWTRPLAGKLSLDNTGTVKGIINCAAAANDAIVNEGTITGETYLGPGNDTFKNTGGHAGRVHGGPGNDTLIAGPHKDKFVFDATLNAATNVDRVKHFDPGTDKLFLSKGIFAALSGPGNLASGEFHKGAVAHDGDDHIIYNKHTGALFYDPDGTGGSPQVEFAKLDKGLHLHASDFVVIA